MLRAAGIRHEAVRVAAIEEGVQHDPEQITVASIEVARQLVRDRALRRLVVQHRADVERRGVVDEADLGAARGRPPLVRLLLHKPRRWRCELPRHVVQHAVEMRHTRHGNGRRDPDVALERPRSAARLRHGRGGA